MLGDRLVMQECLFYQFRLDDHVPADHMLRAIDQFVDLEGLRRHLVPFYSATGRPSIDPELMIRMLFVGYCFVIRSERRLCEEVSLEQCSMDFPRLWGSEEAVFYSGLVPLGTDIFRRIVVRASRVPVIDSSQFSLTLWTDAPLYEICSHPGVYAGLEKVAAAKK